MAGTTKLVYFAWLRERLDRNSEDIALPDDIVTVADLLNWQQGRGEQFAHAFEHLQLVRVALDQEHALEEDAIGTPTEIAFFPPMTGG